MKTLDFKARRLAAHFYDALLTLALMMSSTLLLLVFNHGEALTFSNVGPWQFAYKGFLVGLIVCYFCISWCRRGQTLGLKTWGLYLSTPSGELPSVREAVIRVSVLILMNLSLLPSIIATSNHAPLWIRMLLLLPYAANVGTLLLRGQTIEDYVSGLELKLIKNQRARTNNDVVTNANITNGKNATTGADQP